MWRSPQETLSPTWSAQRRISSSAAPSSFRLSRGHSAASRTTGVIEAPCAASDVDRVCDVLVDTFNQVLVVKPALECREVGPVTVWRDLGMRRADLPRLGNFRAAGLHSGPVICGSQSDCPNMSSPLCQGVPGGLQCRARPWARPWARCVARCGWPGAMVIQVFADVGHCAVAGSPVM